MNQKVRMTLYWLLPFLGFIGMFFTFSWKNLIIFLVTLFIATMGISMALHRYFSHKSYTAKLPMHLFLCLIACFAAQGSPEMWASTHDRHHKFSETPEDPHSPSNGFLHSYFLWMFDETRFGTDTIVTDKYTLWFSKYYGWFLIAGTLLPGIFGWSAILWGGLGRIFVMNNITALTNVFAHNGETRNKNGDKAKNVWWVALLTQGEGWHKNHHDEPGNYFFGREWWQIDITGYLLFIFKKLGWISTNQES